MRFDHIPLDRGRVHRSNSLVPDGSKFQLPCEIGRWKFWRMPPDQARVAGLINRREAITRSSENPPLSGRPKPENRSLRFWKHHGCDCVALFLAHRLGAR